MSSIFLKLLSHYPQFVLLGIVTVSQLLVSGQVVGENVTAATKKIDIILSSGKSRYVDIANSIKNNVQKNRYDFHVVDIDVWAEGDRKTDLIITLGTAAATLLVKKQPSTPIISAYIPQYAYQTLLDENSEYTQKYFVGAVFIDQPILRQLRLVRTLVPGALKVGMILGPISYQSVANHQSQHLDETLQLSTLKVIDQDIHLRNLNQLMRENDVILTLPDPIVHQPFNAKRILYSAYRAKKPVVAFSKAYVNAGALGSIYSSPDQIGLQTAEKIVDYFLLTGSIRKKYETSEYFEISINRNVAWTLDISVPEPAELRRSLNRLEAEDK